ncbi:hypothetical protein BGZ52_004586 [Haplosporangium bisporale]|uniref:Uncharacterized protein n=1 Tax=Podila verticillata NRRL 6337 TaxID=1069443 RepID=A0A086TLR6_9FUNG|nr:hypothetical protein BGZ52_004586 [Haplosporangium bisporale]KAF9205731.1 hypothetical protein BGZ59_000317 [Podila verticillata]KAI9231938.1 MAG: hypothetical protein BYD32DRAFT_186568 [Podila humilis]KFH62893.1 hypothetical protein MVEG_11417 [Podila verticillata NRRL 6337]
MITVPSQEIAAFLGSHLDDVLQRTGSSFLNSVAADREFRAGCAIMDVLNAVDSVQESLRALLEKKSALMGRQTERQRMEVRVVSLYLLHYLYSYLPIHQNPFLCLFVDIYNLASQDENLKSERFVTSLILNGKGEELAPSTPSELIAIAQNVESKPVNIGMLEEFLPEVPIEDQVKVGLGWDRAGAQQERGDRKRLWHTFTLGSRQGDDAPSITPIPAANGSGVNGAKDSGHANGTEKAVEEEEEEELEEWEIEAEKVFQDSDDDVSPSLPVKAPTPPVVKAPVKKASEKIKPIETNNTTNVNSTPSTPRSKVNSPLESPVQSPTDQEQFKRRRKMWQRK